MTPHGGTLFLDEIADMPLTTQGKILRVLTDQSYHRVGGQRPVKVDVRVLSATSRNLQDEIAAGRFREDLFYRLNVVPVLPPEILDNQGAIGGSTATMAIMGSPLREARESFEREYLKIQIRRFSGNISRTASFIGMERSALHRKLKALGIGDKKEGEE